MTLFASLALLVGLWLIGRRNRAGFGYSLIGEVMWTGAAVDRGMYDLAAVCAVFALMAALNWRKWGDE